MSNAIFVVTSLIFGLAIIVGGFFFISAQLTPERKEVKKAIKCVSPKSTISFLIDDETRSVIMAGEAIPEKTITIFNDTAISAKWMYDKEITKVFLDRIAGRLEVEVSSSYGKNEVSNFDCSAVGVRF
ncbi:MAG: hypothetical protein ACRBB3_08065 [Alphaproteobacteria bacterium]